MAHEYGSDAWLRRFPLSWMILLPNCLNMSAKAIIIHSDAKQRKLHSYITFCSFYCFYFDYFEMSESTRSTRALASTEELIQNAEKRLAALIKNCQTELQTSIDSFKTELCELRKNVEVVDHVVLKHDEELISLRKELAEVKKAKAELEKQVILKDIHDCKTNLLFYGIPEKPQENTERVLRNYFVETLQFSEDHVDNVYFKTVHRLPKSEYQRKNKPAAPPSIIATFILMVDLDAVYGALKLLKDTTGSIQTDLPALMKKRRAILGRQAVTIREQEKLWTRVRIVGTEVILETRDPNIPSSSWRKYE